MTLCFGPLQKITVMFNSIVLDVFIGLVLIYLLYSLFITIIGEMVATWMALRSRILRVAIEKMLNDGYHKKHLVKRDFLTRTWNFIQQYFLKEFEDFKYSFAGKFYNNPSIKYLSDKGGEVKTAISQTKPSYISAEMFATTLLQLLKDKGRGATDIDKINFCLRFNTHHIEPSTLKTLRDMTNDAGTDINLLKAKFKAWYNETMDRANGWYKRKLQLLLFWLGFIIAVIFNVDSIQIAKKLSKDKDARNQLVTMGVELSKDSSRYKDFLVPGDSLRSKAIVDSGYANITKDMNDASLVLGLGWGTDKLIKQEVCLLDTAGVPGLLSPTRISKFSDLKDSLLKQQENLNLHLAPRDSISDLIKQLISDTVRAGFEVQAGNKSYADTISLLRKLIAADQAAVQKLQANAARDSFKIRKTNDELLPIKTVADSITGRKFSIISDIRHKAGDPGKIEIMGFVAYPWYAKVGYVAKNIFVPIRLFGLIITGLMLSLGAPFWFDLLKKLVAIRGAGVKPEEKKNNINRATDSEVVMQTGLQPDNINFLKIREDDIAGSSNADTTLYNLTQKTKAESGIISVAKQFDTAANATVLIVFAEDDQTLAYLKTKYGSKETLDNGFSIPIQYATDKKIKVHTGMAGCEIFNQNDALRTGTLGCHLQKEDSNNLYFIYCWHVMKDDTNWHGSLRETTIIQESTALGKIEDGFLSHDTETGIDVGIAKYISDADALSNPRLIIAGQHRSVSEFDALVRTRVRLFGKVCKFREAEIFLHQINAHIKYPDGQVHLMNDVFSITIKDPVTGDKTAPTSEGDSGAIVTDLNGIPLGMIVGGSSNYSYAVKFSNVFTKTGPLKEYRFKINF